jgi:hypothetical protein
LPRPGEASPPPTGDQPPAPPVEPRTEADRDRDGAGDAETEADTVEKGPPGKELQQDAVIRLSEPVVRALVGARAQRGVTTTEVVLDAVDRAWPELQTIIPPAPERASPLPPRTRRRRSGGSRGQRVHLRLTPTERAALENVVDHTTAGSLTDLIERLLRHTLAVDSEVPEPRP